MQFLCISNFIKVNVSFGFSILWKIIQMDPLYYIYEILLFVKFIQAGINFCRKQPLYNQVKLGWIKTTNNQSAIYVIKDLILPFNFLTLNIKKRKKIMGMLGGEESRGKSSTNQNYFDQKHFF